MKFRRIIRLLLPVLALVACPHTARPVGEVLSHYLQGLQFAEEGELDRAIEEMRTAWDLERETPEVARELARLLLEARRAKEAIHPAEVAVRFGPEVAESHWLLGQAYLQLSREEESLPFLRRAWELARDETSYLATYLLTLEALERFEEALDLLTPERGGVEPMSPYLTMRRAAIHTRLGHPQEAMEDYLATLQLAPGYPGAADHLLALCWRLGPSRVTASAASRALDLVPDRIDLRRELSRILILLNRQEEAVPHLERLLEDEPADATVPMQLGVVRFGQERLPEAIRLFRRARSLDPELPDSGDWLWRALSRADSVEAALTIAQEMVLESPESPAATWYHANSLARLGRAEESLEALRKVHRLDPTNREARLLASILLEERGDLAAAREQLEAALESRPKDRETLFRLAVLEERSGHLDRAVDRFWHLLEAYPDDAMALNYAGYLCAEEGIELDQALVWTARAVALDDRNAAYIDSYGWVLYRLGRYEEATTQLERAYRLAPREAEIRIHLAKAYRAAGRIRQGRQILRELLSEYPQDRQARDLLQLWERGEAETGNPR